MASRFILPFADIGSGISPSDGAKLEFFESGTSTQKDTFTDEALTTSNANPVISNGDGVFDETDIFLPDGGRYKVTLKDKNNVLIFESDPVVGGVSANITSKTFDIVADMVASPELNIGDIVETAGYTSKGDGGDNQYEIVGPATGTDDGGSFIDLTGITGQANGLFPGGIHNVNQFGAIGNAATDDTAEIQSLIDFMENLSATGVTRGGTVHFLEGQYLISSTLTITKGRVSIKGAGRFNTLITRSTDFGDTIIVSDGASGLIEETRIEDISFFHNAATPMTSGAHVNFLAVTHGNISNFSMANGFRGVVIQGCVDITISRGSIFGSGAASDSLIDGILLNGLSTAGTPLPTQIKIEDVQSFSGAYGQAIQINAGEQVNIEGKSYFGNAFNHNVLINQTSSNFDILDITFGDDVFIDGTFAASTFDGNSVNITGASGDGSKDINGVIFSGTTIRGQGGTSRNLIFVDGTSRGGVFDQALHNLLVTGCSLLGADDSGIVLGGGSLLSIKGNIISASNINDATPDSSGIDVQANCDRVTIDGNQVGSDARGLATGFAAHGIRLRVGVTNISVTDNDVVHNVTNGILDSSGDATSSNRKVISNNTGDNQGTKAVTVPASATVLVNPLGYNAYVSIFSGTVSDVKLDGTTIFTGTGVQLPVPAGSTIQVTYSVIPNWTWWRQ